LKPSPNKASGKTVAPGPQFKANREMQSQFGQVIRQWREQARLSQEELAWRAMLHRTYISDIERGARNPSLLSVGRLAQALQVSLSTLFKPLEAYEKKRK
jgi:transcriptional regulator with XRE-family HTH domain